MIRLCYILYLAQAMNDRFNYELNQHIEGTLPKGHIYQLGKPGQILQNAGIPNLPIELKAGRLEHKASENYKNKHQFDIAYIKDLPKAINEPIAVFNSTKSDGAKIILTDLKDKKGNNFVAVIKMYKDALGKKNSMDINSIVSVYPKDNIAELKNWFKSGNKLIAWQDKEKASNFISSQSPFAIAREYKTEALEREVPTDKYTKISEKKQELNDNSEKNLV